MLNGVGVSRSGEQWGHDITEPPVLINPPGSTARTTAHFRAHIKGPWLGGPFLFAFPRLGAPSSRLLEHVRWLEETRPILQSWWLVSEERPTFPGVCLFQPHAVLRYGKMAVWNTPSAKFAECFYFFSYNLRALFGRSLTICSFTDSTVSLTEQGIPWSPCKHWFCLNMFTHWTLAVIQHRVGVAHHLHAQEFQFAWKSKDPPLKHSDFFPLLLC